MKKSSALILIIILTAFLIIPISGGNVMPGDIDKNGNVTAADARSALRFSAQIEIPTDEQLAAADVDGNGRITAMDARMILRVAANLDSFPEQDEPDSSDEEVSDAPIDTPEIPQEDQTVLPEEETSDILPEEPVIPDEEPSDSPDEPSVNNEYPKEVEAVLNSYYKMSGTENEMEDFEYTLATDSENLYLYLNSDMLGVEYGILALSDGSVYMLNEKKQTCCVLDDTMISALGLNDIISMDDFKVDDSADDEYEITVSTKTEDRIEYTVYAITVDNAVLELYTINDAVTRYAQYDSDELVMDIDVHTFETEFDTSIFDINIYTEVNVTTFISDMIYSEDDYFFPDYMEDTYWQDEIDWESISAQTITNDEDLPEEYHMIANDNMYLNAIFRSAEINDYGVAYSFWEYMILKDAETLRVFEDPYYSDMSILVTEETNIFGQPKTVYYVFNEYEMIYTELDSLLMYSLGIYKEDLDAFTVEKTKLISDDAHTVTVKETTVDENINKCITCTYEDGTSGSFYFENGTLLRFDEYDADGVLVLSAKVYEFANDFDESYLTTDGYNKVIGATFLAKLMYW